MIYIYTLIDPRTNEVRYVGKTIEPKQRLANHIRKSRKPKQHCQCWIKGLLDEGLKPLLKVLLVVEDSDWEYYEIETIKLFPNLTNRTEGGQSVWWSKLSEEEKESFRIKMKKVNKERPISEATREIWRQSAIKIHTGRKCTDKHKALMSEKMKGEKNHRFGVEVSQETRDRLSKAGKGRKHSEETKSKMKSIQTELHGIKVSQFDLQGNFIATYNSTKEAQEASGAHRSNIGACCKGRLKTTGGFIWRYA
jgi:group I intron endonuclease